MSELRLRSELAGRLLALMWLLMLPINATAADPVGPGDSPEISIREISNVPELTAFVDGVVETAMAQHDTAGVVVAITRDDQVLLAKGYGFADVEQRTPVDPATTLFRIGSVTKLFTWTALMQLAEQGRIDLDTDINEYLTRIQIPETFPEPVTVADLMTHSGGFEDRIIGLFSLDPASMRPYGELLAEDLPQRVRPPGWVSSYSNHGVGVAGLIVEEVSGMAWEEYVRQHILEPLGMNSTAAAQPIPVALAGQRARGYSLVDGQPQEQPFQYVPLGAVGGMSASALDMTRFAMAHLNDGAYPGGRILEWATASTMHTPLFQPYPELNGWLHGFADNTTNGRFIYGHDGGTFWFFSGFLLMPEENLSLFVSTNTAGGGQVNRALIKGLLDRYFPEQVEPPIAVANGSDLLKFAGAYGTFRHPFTTPGKALRLLNPVTVAVTAGDQLQITGLGSKSSRWQEVTAGVFRNVDANRHLRLVIDEQGTRMFVDSAAGSFYRLTGLHTPAFQSGVLALSMLLLGWALLAWPIQFLRRKLKRSEGPPRTLHRSRVVLWVASVSVFITFIGLAQNASQEMVYGLTPVMSFLLLMPVATLALLLAELVIMVPLMRDATVAASSRVYHLALIFSLVAVSALLYYWNLIGG